MNYKMNEKLGDKYKSPTQKARVITEAWILENFKCPYCEQDLEQYGANNKCADFYCKKCGEEFELKSKKGKFSKGKINGAEYKATLEKIRKNKGVNWILLEHNNYKVESVTFIPRYLIFDGLIEARKPLSDTARRAGWQGCKICIDKIPSFGKIQYIKNGESIDKKIIKYKLEKVEFFRNSDFKNKDWKLEVLSIVDMMQENIFILKELLEFVPDLQIKHPNNKNIDAKIREMLQILRNDGYIDFIDKGLYLKKF